MHRGANCFTQSSLNDAPAKECQVWGIDYVYDQPLHKLWRELKNKKTVCSLKEHY